MLVEAMTFAQRTGGADTARNLPAGADAAATDRLGHGHHRGRHSARPCTDRVAPWCRRHWPACRCTRPTRISPFAGNQRPWPADKVERWSIDRLIPYARNARTHTDAQVAAIAASIKEWGWTSPALVGEDGGLIAGHARVLAARQLGIAEIPVMVAAGWTALPPRVRAPATRWHVRKTQ